MTIARPFNRREKIIAWVCAGVLFSFANREFVLKPLQAQRAALQRRIVENRKLIAKELQYVQLERQRSARYEPWIEPLRQRASKEQEVSSLLSQVQQLAGEGNLEVTEMKPRKIKNEETFKTLSISLSVNGSLNDILKFLHAVQSPSVNLGIQEFNLEPKSSPNNGLTCRLDLSRILVPQQP